MDAEWALDELNRFLELTELYRPPSPPGIVVGSSRRQNKGSQEEIVMAAHVVEQILDRVVRNWRTEVPDGDNAKVNRWCQHIEATRRACAALRREAEVQEKLGEFSPRISASELHPWVWDGAKSLWQSGHYGQAVVAAAIKLNAETQNKVGRRDVSETNLFKEVFSEQPPQPGKPRLRLHPDDGSDTFKSIHRGARTLAEGCYAAFRNPNSHELRDELPEHEALEQLATFSVLARWVDSASLES